MSTNKKERKSIIKKELLKTLNEFFKMAPNEKKSQIGEVEKMIKNSKFANDKKNSVKKDFDDSAFLLFLLTNGFDMMKNEDKQRLYKFADNIRQKVLSQQTQARPLYRTAKKSSK